VKARASNTWQSRGDRHIMRLLNEYRLEGAKSSGSRKPHRNSQTSRETSKPLPISSRSASIITARKPTNFWRAGKIERACELLKIIRQTGSLVGLATHMPEVIDYVESKGWDLDFYMTCLYNLSRTPEEAEKLAGRPVKGEWFRDADREQMLARVRQTSKPCLIFKVYAASRQCDSEDKMLGAVRLAAASAKPADCFVIGMYPRHAEQVRQMPDWYLRSFVKISQK